MSKILLQDVDFSSLLRSSARLQEGAVLAGVVGFDVFRLETFPRMTCWGNCFGGFVVLGGGYR